MNVFTKSSMVLLVSSLLSLAAEARSPGQVTLMPAREVNDTVPDVDSQTPPPPVAAAPDNATFRSEGEPVRIGFELGALGMANTPNPNFLGLQTYLGGRITSMVPVLGDMFVIRPALGYFYRYDTSVYPSQFQNEFEGDLNVQFVWHALPDLRILAGVTQSFTVGYTRVNVGTSWVDQPLTYSYRIGPSAGILYQVTDSIGLLVDGETTFDFYSPPHPLFGLMGGLVFSLH